MTRNPLPVSTCQKVQPLQLGAPCTPAPTLWIDPAGWPSQSRLPSTRTFAFQRRLLSVISVPGALSPHQPSVPNATSHAALGAIIVFSALSSRARARRIRPFAPATTPTPPQLPIH